LNTNPATSHETADEDRYEQALMTCVHCGLCLNACPTYLETGSEADSPRGRIVLMGALFRGELDPASADVRQHIDRCLGCRACETACPSAVPYGDLLDVARASVNDTRPKAQKAARGALLESLTDPAKLRLSLVASRLTGGIPSPVARLLAGDPAEADAAGPAPSPKPSNAAPLPAIIPSVGKRRARVGMLAGCVMRVLYGDVNRDTVAVLAANGCEVLVNQAQGCCGALHLHNGFSDRGEALAKKLIDAFTPFDGLDAIVINSAGCGSTMKEYVHILAGDPAYAARAAAFSAKVKDVTEFLDELGMVAPLSPLEGKVTYHDACHLGHAQRVTAAPRRVLDAIPGLEIVPLPETEICCGSAGIYNLTEPALSRKFQKRKVDNIKSTGAQTVVTGNPGCMAWIEAGLAGAGIRVIHPVTLLREALANPVKF
jgi:glycolate oxidase iron-sulfur subunit